MEHHQKGTLVKIYLNIEADSPAEFRLALAELMNSTALPPSAPYPGPYGDGQQTEAGTSTSVQSDLSDIPTVQTQQRERGKPSEGRARRTKEEIAEDEAADKADAAVAAAGAETGGEVADRQISNDPENRTDPDNPQDAADEAAETEATKAASGKALTHDDVRNELGAYVKAYGMAAAQEDGPKVIALMFGEGKTKVSDIPDDQASLAKAVAGVKEMTQKNPYERKADL